MQEAVLRVGEEAIAVAVNPARGHDAGLLVVFPSPPSRPSLEITRRGVAERLPAGSEAKHHGAGDRAHGLVLDQRHIQRQPPDSLAPRELAIGGAALLTRSRSSIRRLRSAST